LLAGFASLAPVLLAACAQPPRADPRPGEFAFWRGRLALRVENDENTAFFANFELSGSPHSGELRLSNSLGTTLAQLQWDGRRALLRSNGQARAFDSLDALATEATGTSIPIAALFLWLQGQAAAADGWWVDLTQLETGRLLARRREPAPVTELRLVLEP
jgi:outer membrane lipoprotein LolB